MLLRVGGHSERLHGSTERIVRNIFVDVFGIFVHRWRVQACERFVHRSLWLKQRRVFFCVVLIGV